MPVTRSFMWMTGLVGVLVVILLVVLPWASRFEQSAQNSPRNSPRNGPRTNEESGSGHAPAATTPSVLHLSLVPERDIFAQRKRYQALGDYLSGKIGCEIKFTTPNNYQGVLEDFAHGATDGAFLGSLVTVLAYDMFDARVLVKPESAQGVSTYRGVIVVREDSPIQKVEDLAGKSLGMVRATMAGNLYPYYLLLDRGVLAGGNPPKFRWLGTHDDVLREVVAGNVDAGAVKDLRLQAFQAIHPAQGVRALAYSAAVPDNALVVRAGLAPELVRKLEQSLLDMNQDPQGRAALAKFGAAKFLPCRIEEYQAIYDMAERMGPDWDKLGVSAPMPRRKKEGK